MKCRELKRRRTLKSRMYGLPFGRFFTQRVPRQTIELFEHTRNTQKLASLGGKQPEMPEIPRRRPNSDSQLPEEVSLREL